MIVFIFLAMGLSSENKSAFPNNDCAYLRQQCLRDGTPCKHAWRIAKDACNISEGEPVLPSGLASPPAITQWSPRKDVLSAAEQQSDCVTAARICWESQHCAALYENFSKVCSRKAKECKHPGGRQLCAALRKSLTETLLWTCQCNNSSHVACSQIWKSLFEDVCIQDAQMNEVPTLSEDLGVEVGQDSVSGSRGMPSCLEIMEACVGDVGCNAHLASYLKACSAQGSLCDRDHCQTATQSFYQSVPLNVAQMLAFCDCAPSDTPCQQSREALHSRRCMADSGPPPTCLSVIRSCRDDELCRRRYRTFQLKCWPHVTEKCHEDETCIGTLSKRDVTCSGSEDCTAAYIGILGTVLQGRCTCRGTAQTEESLCKIFQQLLHRKSCFNYPILSNVKGLPLYERKHAKEITFTGFHSPINGEVIYAVMCMTVVCGVLLLVMLKLRISRISSQTRNPSPIQISGGIIIH
nr:GDNF family receptor alpha-like [Cavia porcellus]